MSFEMALFAALLTVIGIPAVIYGLGELLTSLDCRTAPRQKRREFALHGAAEVARHPRHDRHDVPRGGSLRDEKEEFLMGFADHPYCVVLQTHDPDSTDSAQESAYADDVLVLALTHPQDDGKIIRGKLMINGDAKRLARALLATDFRDAIRGAIRDALDESDKHKRSLFDRLFRRKEDA